LAQNHPNCEQLAGIFEDVPVSSSNSGRDFLIANVVHPQDMHQPGLLIETVGDHSEAKAEIKEVFNKWNKSGSDVYLDYGYLEDFYKEGLEPERDLITLMEMFVALSILISLLGLMAMSAYFADERSRDIAIRKVFGATVDSELRKNVKDYMVLILIACAIAAPLAVFAARMYIMSFTDKITGYVWIIVLAVVFTLVMSFFSVFWQTLKAAQTNPADRLR
jgi:putative ABC transport system permease protein